MSYQQYERMEVIKMLHCVGKMVNKLRKGKGIAQADLARGILSMQEYYRFESGNKELDKMHLEALFQRLGKSEDKLERAISTEEYRILSIRYDILALLSEGKIKEADEKISEYQTYADREKPLYRQAVLLFQALRNYTEDKDRKRAVFTLEQALEITLPKWENVQLEKVYLCTQEIQIFLLLIYFNIEEERMHPVLKTLFSYIDKRYTDGEERVRVYPQCAWLLGQVYFSENNIERALEVCENGIGCLVENGAMSLMKEMLELKAACLQLLGKDEEITGIENQKAAIDLLYEIAGISYVEEKSISILWTSRETEIIVLNEVVREMRQAKGITQTELSENICSPETLSRIESGGRSPNRNNIYAMLHKMGLNRESYYGAIMADNYELYEKVRNYKRGISQRDWKLVSRLKEELEESLDLDDPVNKQFIETGKVQEKLRENPPDYKWGLGELKRILRYTWSDYNDEIYRIPSREETIILNHMAICLRADGKIEEGIKIYKQILDRFDNSMVSNDFHAAASFLIYTNYTGFLETNGELEQAERIGKEGLGVMIKCQRGDVAADILANMSCIYEKPGIKRDTELAEKCLRSSYYLMVLYQDPYYEKMIREIYEITYFKKLT